MRYYESYYELIEQLIKKELRAMIVEETAREVRALEDGIADVDNFRQTQQAARTALASPELLLRLSKLISYERDKAYAEAAEVYEQQQ